MDVCIFWVGWGRDYDGFNYTNLTRGHPKQ